MTLGVISTDLMFNISNLVVPFNFPSKDQARAGSVFNTVSQLGNSIRLAVKAIMTSNATGAAEGQPGVTDPYTMLQRYRNGLWTCFAAAWASTVVSSIGLRNTGKVGVKKDV
ncbi:hypothetical protein F5Y16DRAFT_376682 [Xylariaceae sp. FL0255]|nr:hypothetical protein F5Y16DRAFT_376682 [Xylariaceae sp. FL0255]